MIKRLNYRVTTTTDTNLHINSVTTMISWMTSSSLLLLPRLTICYIVLLCCLLPSGLCEQTKYTLLNGTKFEVEPHNTELHYAQNTLTLVNKFKEHVRNRLVTTFNLNKLWKAHHLATNNHNNNITSDCLLQLKTSLEASTDDAAFEWLLQMYQSSGNIPSGLFSGTTTSLGDYDQCLRISSQSGANQTQETQYCLLTLQAHRKHKYMPIQLDEQHSKHLTSWERRQIEKWLVTDNRVPIVIGLCIPAICTADEFTQIAVNASDLIQHFETRVDYCQGNTKENYLLKLAPMLVCLLFLCGLVGLGTFYDFIYGTQFGQNWASEKNSFHVQSFMCFSLISNLKTLFSTQDSQQYKSLKNETEILLPTTPVNGNGYHKDVVNNSKNGDDNDVNGNPVKLQVLNGIRVFTIVWIIIAHCCSYTQVPSLMRISPLMHFPDALQRSKQVNQITSIISVYLLSTYYAVSIFFMISGILVIYNRKRKRPGQCDLKYHFFQHLISRIMRIAPAFLTTMGITYCLRYLGSGPMFQQKLVEPYVEPCRTHFWYHLFFVHNFLPVKQRCGSHTWYVGADFQLNILAFFIVHLIRCQSKQILGLVITAAVMIISGFIPLSLITMNIGQMPNFDTFVDSRTELPEKDLVLFYYATYMHAGSFFVGLLLGFVLSNKWDLSFIHKKKFTRFVLLLVSVTSLFTVPLAMRYLVFDDTTNWWPIAITSRMASNLLSAILFQIFSYAFNIALALLIFIAVLNPTLFVSKILSAKCLQPLSRLVYSAYLLHQMLIWFTLHQSHTLMVVNIYSSVFFCTMIIALTIVLSIMLYLLIECPFVRLSKFILSSQINSSSSSSESNNTIKMHSISTVSGYTNKIIVYNGDEKCDKMETIIINNNNNNNKNADNAGDQSQKAQCCDVAQSIISVV